MLKPYCVLGDLELTGDILSDLEWQTILSQQIQPMTQYGFIPLEELYFDCTLTLPDCTGYNAFFLKLSYPDLLREIQRYHQGALLPDSAFHGLKSREQ